MNAQKTLVSALSLTLVLALEIPLMAATIPAPEDVAKAPKDAITTDSGLKHKLIRKGTGTLRPGARDTVKVHYTGWTTDGKMFDSSVARGETISFPLNRVIKGWTEGVQLMVEGEKTRFWIPGELAYGNTPSRPGAPVGMLVFDIELFEIHCSAGMVQHAVDTVMEFVRNVQKRIFELQLDCKHLIRLHDVS